MPAWVYRPIRAPKGGGRGQQGHERGPAPQTVSKLLYAMQAGEFWWKLALDATPALPQPPIMLSAALGSTTSHTLAVANPTPVEATFTSSSSCPDRFWLAPDTFKVGIVLLRWSVLHMQAIFCSPSALWHCGNAWISHFCFGVAATCVAS